MCTVWAWQVVEGSRNSEWLLIHFPVMREGQVYYLHSCYGETDENISTKQEIRTKISICCITTLSCERIWFETVF